MRPNQNKVQINNKFMKPFLAVVQITVEYRALSNSKRFLSNGKFEIAQKCTTVLSNELKKQ